MSDDRPIGVARSKASGTTYRLLQRLIASQGKVVTHEALEFAAYGDRPDGGPDGPRDSIRTLMHHLRKQLPPGSIGSAYGVGYVLRAGVLVDLPPLDDARIVLALTAEDERQMRVAMRQARQAAGMGA